LADATAEAPEGENTAGEAALLAAGAVLADAAAVGAEARGIQAGTTHPGRARAGKDK
jgi:hypothetical protein